MAEKTILLVEDSPEAVDLTMEGFKSCKGDTHRVVVVKDGEEALDYIFSKGKYAGARTERPDLVLLDVRLPKVSGLDVLRAVRTNRATQFIPIVVLTASRDEKDLYAGYLYGANSYIVKPLEFERYIALLGVLCSYWLSMNEPPPRVRA